MISGYGKRGGYGKGISDQGQISFFLFNMLDDFSTLMLQNYVFKKRVRILLLVENFFKKNHDKLRYIYIIHI